MRLLLRQSPRQKRLPLRPVRRATPQQRAGCQRSQPLPVLSAPENRPTRVETHRKMSRNTYANRVVPSIQFPIKRSHNPTVMKTSSVMIVEDDARIRSMIRRLIGDLVVSVYECSGGQEAVELYCRLRPDLVLMDLRLEGLDGLSATRAIRDSFPEARLIIVTSYDAPHVRAAAPEPGAINYLLKDDFSTLL